MNPYVYCNFIYRNQDMETTQVSVRDEWFKKCELHIKGTLFSLRKKEVLLKHSNMDEPGGRYVE